MIDLMPSRYNPRREEWDWIRPTKLDGRGDLPGLWPRWGAACKRCPDSVYGEDVAEVRDAMREHDHERHPPKEAR